LRDWSGQWAEVLVLYPLRGIFLKGVGLEVLWPQALALTAWGVGILTLATLRSSKRLA
jgi:ABC-2 type transport system permease protein